MLTGGLQDDDPDIGVFVGAPPGVVEILEDARCLGVGGLGAVQGDDRDPVVDVVADEVLSCHGCIPFGGVLTTLSCAKDATCDPDWV